MAISRMLFEKQGKYMTGFMSIDVSRRWKNSILIGICFRDEFQAL